MNCSLSLIEKEEQEAYDEKDREFGLKFFSYKEHFK